MTPPLRVAVVLHWETHSANNFRECRCIECGNVSSRLTSPCS